jgi:Trypsin-like peptidase domain
VRNSERPTSWWAVRVCQRHNPPRTPAIRSSGAAHSESEGCVGIFNIRFDQSSEPALPSFGSAWLSDAAEIPRRGCRGSKARATSRLHALVVVWEMKRQFTRIYKCLSRQGSGSARQESGRSLAVKLVIGCCLAVATVASVVDAHPQSTDDSLRIYAVNIVHDPPQSWTGYGIYLGRGLVITAAHVVGSAAHTNPSVRIAGMELPAKAIKEGSVERVDLTLLSIDTQKLPIYLQMRRMPLCEKPPWAGEPVIVAVPEGTARSRIMSPQLLPPDVRTKFHTLISDVATTGNSGSGVFDAGTKCLLGIMSRKISSRPSSADEGSEQKDIAKYFVAASMIRAFIPTEYPF